MNPLNLSNPRASLPCASFAQRCHAALMARVSPRQDELVATWKARLLTPLRGTVLEIGPGTGPNLKYYDPSVTWIGIEPNPAMHPYLHAEAARLGRAVTLRAAQGDRLPADEASVDAVVSTLVLCSVADPVGMVREIRRVLKPGGQFLFVEHVAAPRSTQLRQWQRWLRPLWRRLGDGCHPDRETWVTLEQAGFAQVDIHHFTLPAFLVGPHIAGVAIK
jgi:SAM-dependent methyltransferase